MELKKYKLGELLSKIENGAVIKQNKGAKGIPITRIETLSNGLFNRDKLGYADIEDPTLYSDYILEDNDLLMSHINVTILFSALTRMFPKPTFAP